MKDLMTVILLVVLVIGIWFAAYIFATISGVGLALIFLYNVIKQGSEHVSRKR